MPSDPRPPAPGPETLTLATFLPYRLNVAAAEVSEGLARLYGERFGIGIPEWRVLATLGEFRRLTGKAVGAHARMSKVKVSRAAAALEARGLVRRDRNAADLREAFLWLTPAGEAVYAEIVPLALAYVERLTAALPREDRAVLERALSRLHAAARDMAG